MAQSPIDLRNADCTYDPTLGDGGFKIDFDASDLEKIVRTPNNWRVDVKTGGGNTIVEANHLPDKYRLIQFHMHWGLTPSDGCEHLVEGKQYGAELHLVTMNVKYDKLEDALNDPHGLAVLGIFLEETPNEAEATAAFASLTADVQKLGKDGDSVPISPGIDMWRFVPKDNLGEYWTYDGSLTTPPYSECVLWTVFKNPVKISSTQLNVFRKIVGDNSRAPQPLNGRKLRRSFKI